MDDTISRQATIDALMAWEEGSVWDEECLKHRGEPYWVAPSDVIEQLPSAQPEPQWIPCSEPPTKHGFYHEILLYGEDGNYAVGWYDEDYFTWDDRFDTNTPIAWMPLPECYKGES